MTTREPDARERVVLDDGEGFRISKRNPWIRTKPRLKKPSEAKDLPFVY